MPVISFSSSHLKAISRSGQTEFSVYVGLFIQIHTPHTRALTAPRPEVVWQALLFCFVFNTYCLVWSTSHKSSTEN